MAMMNHVGQQQASINLQGMEAKLYEAALCGSFEKVRLISDWKEQETPTKNNILHVHVGTPLHKEKKDGTRKGMVNMDFIVNVLNDESGYSLLWKENSNGDTPLHLAARFGQDKAVQVFIQQATSKVNQDEVTKLLKATNKNKDTALHEAARAGHASVVKLLVEADLNCPYDQNEGSETPLYLATERGSTPSVLTILTISNLAYGGPCGRTALHAAVQWGDPEMVSRILENDRSLIRIQNNEGRTPFHCAAAEVYKLEHLEILLKYDNYDGRSSALYIQDNIGRTALHIAMLRRNYDAIKKMVDSCPDCIEIADNMGQNVVHYAAKWSSLWRIISCVKIGHLDRLINDKDVDGNTPLHILSDSISLIPSNYHVPFSVSRLPKYVKNLPFMDLKAYNKKNLTVGDIMLKSDTFLRQERILVGRNCKVAPRGRRIDTYENDIDLEKAVFGGDTGEWNLLSLKKSAQNRLVVAALIATVSFTAGFTLPGGFDQNAGKNMGMAVLQRKTLFKVFLVSDAMAFASSTIAIIIYFVLVATDASWHIQNLSYWGLLMNTFSLGSLMIAFLAGVFTVLSKSLALIIAIICVISLAFFVTYCCLISRVSNVVIRRSRTNARNHRVLH